MLHMGKCYCELLFRFKMQFKISSAGVELLRYGQKIQIRCRKEIILSAGAIGSPQILMMSGVGPEAHLKERKVEKLHFWIDIFLHKYVKQNLN